MIFFLDTQYDSMFMSIFMPVPQSFDYSGFLVSFEKKKKNVSSSNLFFSQDMFLAIWDMLRLHMNLNINFPFWEE